ncbi:MAG: ABC transporter ATP-binding protein [Parvibaculales bacterium]
MARAGCVMLELAHIQYMVGEKRVLQNISAAFPAGHITGIVGPNGAGKTSLLRVAAGLAQVSAGTVMAQGDFADAVWRAKNIAYMPQFQSVAWPLSVREVVALGLLPLNLGSAESEKRVDAALQRCGMARFAARRIDTLSGGEKARVYLARLLATGAPIMLLDEPVQSLDAAGALAVMRLLEAEAAAGKAVIVVMHELNLAQQFCDALVVMQNGTVALEGDAQHILSPDRLRPIFGVEFKQLAGGHLVAQDVLNDETPKEA